MVGLAGRGRSESEKKGFETSGRETSGRETRGMRSRSGKEGDYKLVKAVCVSAGLMG
jgi:hypothetical protein